MKRGQFLFRRKQGGNLWSATSLGLSEPASDGSVFETGPEIELLRQEPAMDLRDEVIFLAHTATEIEHSLLVQYLYAAYSLDAVSPQKGWKRTLLAIAREEMGHLICLQNLLRALGGPLNFDREDYPFKVFYPFPFRLEPLTRPSIARYILAEMPTEESLSERIRDDLVEVRREAGVGVGQSDVNRVGLLYALLLDLLSKLSPEEFLGGTSEFQATPDEWNAYGGVIVSTVRNQDEAVDVITRIARQGEGQEDPLQADESHFHRLYQIWKKMKSIPGWSSGLLLPKDPTTRRNRSRESGFISNKHARMWADLFDTRYRILLMSIAHSQLETRTGSTSNGRAKLVEWSFREMFRMPEIVNVLTRLPQHDPAMEVGDIQRAAGPPFSLPYTLSLPDRPVDRWKTHRSVLRESKARVQALRNEAPDDPNPVLSDIENSDRKDLEWLESHMSSLKEQLMTATNGPPGFVHVGSVDDFPEGSVNEVTVDGQPRALYHVVHSTEGVDPTCPFYTSQVQCWHRTQCELSKSGQLSGNVVSCSENYKPGCAHGSEFDVVTGERLKGPAPENKPLVVYETRCVDGEVWVSRSPREEN